MHLPFRRFTYKHLNKILLSKSALLHNHTQIQNLDKNVLICPVLKSNAYGHGLRQLACVFDVLDCPFLAVDSLFEAYELYKLKVKTPVLIMGYTNPENFKYKKLPFHFALFDLETAAILNKYQQGCNVHIFIDTGLHREGIQIADLKDFLLQLKQYKNINVVGLFSHFADANNEVSDKYTKEQVKEYKKGLKIMQECGYEPKRRHIAASSGYLITKDPIFNMARVGVSYYGINPFGLSKKLNLKPVLTFTSTLAEVKYIKKGSKIGYGGLFTAQNDMVIGIVSAGYYDGVDKRLTNIGYVKIRDQFFPIVGRVSMNITTIDITDLTKPMVGEQVIIYSPNPEDKNSILNTAKLVGTIPHEITTHLAESTHRKVVN